MLAAGRVYITYPSRSNQLTIWNISDIHLGNAACALKKVRQQIEHIRKDPLDYWFGGGDYAEYIGLRDKRFDPDSVADYIKIKDMGQLGKVLMEQVRDLFKPIAHKCLGLLKGNHERSYEVRTEQTHLHEWLCTELGVKNLQYSALRDVIFVRERGESRIIKKVGQGKTKTKVRFFLHHGAGFAQTPGGKLNRLIKAMDSFEADVYMMGHVHDQMGRREPRIAADARCTKLQAKERVGIISGSYLRTYHGGSTTYGEQRGYRPVTLGASCIKIRPDTREFRGEV